MYNIYYLGTTNLTRELLAQQVVLLTSIAQQVYIEGSDVVVTDYPCLTLCPIDTAKYGHAWKWNDKDYGGVRLLPKR